MKQDLVIRQAWPVRRGRAAVSPSEASKAFTRDFWQAAEVIAPQPDRFGDGTAAAEGPGA